MGRKPSIDKAHLLEAAERIIINKGAAALSFDSVAKETGVSKGGVQNIFGSKETLLKALIAHLDGNYDKRFQAALATGSSPTKAYMNAIIGGDSAITQRAATLSLALTLEPESRDFVRKWYSETFTQLNTSSVAKSDEIIHLCAFEGAMMLRFMNLLPLTEQDWDTVFKKIADDSTK